MSTTPTWRHVARNTPSASIARSTRAHGRRRRHQRLAHEQQRELRRHRAQRRIEVDASAVGDGDDVGRRRQQAGELARCFADRGVRLRRPCRSGHHSEPGRQLLRVVGDRRPRSVAADTAVDQPGDVDSCAQLATSPPEGSHSASSVG